MIESNHWEQEMSGREFPQVYPHEYSSSESEEEDEGHDPDHSMWMKSPHFAEVYNYTKLFDKRKVDGTLVDNYVRGEIDGQHLLKDVEVLSSCITFGSLGTIICAVLRTIHGVHKKFVFTNAYEYDCESSKSNVFGQEFFDKVHELGYHLWKTQHSHVEMGLVQFLEARKNKYVSLPVFTASSHPACVNCDKVLRVYFGEYNNMVLLPDQEWNGKYFYTPDAVKSCFEKLKLKRKGYSGEDQHIRVEQDGYYEERADYWKDGEFERMTKLSVKHQEKFKKAMRRFRHGESIHHVKEKTGLDTFSLLKLTKSLSITEGKKSLLEFLDEALESTIEDLPNKSGVLSIIKNKVLEAPQLSSLEREFVQDLAEMEFKNIIACIMIHKSRWKMNHHEKEWLYNYDMKQIKNITDLSYFSIIMLGIFIDNPKYKQVFRHLDSFIIKTHSQKLDKFSQFVDSEKIKEIGNIILKSIDNDLDFSELLHCVNMEVIV